jgi:hypothetical protein
MSKFQGEIVGRCAIGVLGLLLLLGAFKCFKTASRINDDFNHISSSRSDLRGRASGTGLPTCIGVVLTLLGAPLTIAAVIPTRWFEKIMGRQKNTTLWQGSDVTESVRDWSDLL